MKGDMLTSVIVVVIILASSILVLNAINPMIKQSNDVEVFNEARQTMQVIDTAINQLLLEAPGARRNIDVNLRSGKLSVIGSSNEIKLSVNDVNLFSPGFRSEEGNVLITSGASMDAYESDIDNDGTTDLVMENSVMLFAIKKLGNSSSPVVVNTSDMITLIANKRTGVNVTNPRSGIFINDNLKTTYGVGYTELTKIGNSIDSSAIRVYVNATEAGVTYSAVFSMAPSQDFVDMTVNQVTGK